MENLATASQAETLANRPAPKLVAIASGKGGVGKTLSCLGLGWYLAKVGYRVAAVDMDFGVGNLHVSAGLGRVEKSLDDYVHSKSNNLDDLLIPLEENSKLSILAAAGRRSSATTMSVQRKYMLLKELRTLDVDFVLLDIGAGSSKENVEYFLAADYQLAVATADLSAITALISFLKKAQIHNIIKHSAENYPGMAALLENDYSQVSGIYNGIEKLVGESVGRQLVQEALKKFQPVVVLNRVEEGDLSQIQRVNKNLMRQLKTKTVLLGTIPEDPAITRCRRRGQNYLAHSPEGIASKALAAIASKWNDIYNSQQPASPMATNPKHSLHDPLAGSREFA